MIELKTTLSADMAKPKQKAPTRTMGNPTALPITHMAATTANSEPTRARRSPRLPMIHPPIRLKTIPLMKKSDWL